MGEIKFLLIPLGGSFGLGMAYFLVSRLSHDSAFMVLAIIVAVVISFLLNLLFGRLANVTSPRPRYQDAPQIDVPPMGVPPIVLQMPQPEAQPPAYERPLNMNNVRGYSTGTPTSGNRWGSA